MAMIYTLLKLSETQVGLAQGNFFKSFLSWYITIYIYIYTHIIMFVGSFFPAIKQSQIYKFYGFFRWVSVNSPPGARRRNHLQGDSWSLGQSDPTNIHGRSMACKNGETTRNSVPLKMRDKIRIPFLQRASCFESIHEIEITYVQVGITVVVSLSCSSWFCDPDIPKLVQFVYI